jgi:NADH dehydrogenase [ubiquinone] 1 alpha subcomplex assembly factor 6
LTRSTTAGFFRAGSESSSRSQLSNCAAEVREHDPDRYLATLFAPPAAREALFALYAFDHEIAKVRHVVREPMAGLVRFQWWRDALDGIDAGKPPVQPVVAALRAHWAAFAPLRPRLDAAIDGRELELSADPPADLAALERRLEAGCGEITLAAVDLLGASDAPAHAAARHLGLALGLIRLVQALPADLDRERMRLPSAMLDRHEVNPEGSGQAGDGRALAPAVAELAARARAHLGDARRYRRDVPKQALAALLHATLLDHYLDRLARARHDPFAHVPTRPAGTTPLRLLGRHLLGRY